MTGKTPTRLFRAELKRVEYFETIPEGVSLDEALTAGYWVHVFKQIQVFDVFELVAEDGSFDVRARVVSKTPTSLKFRILSGIERDEEAVPPKEVKPGRYQARHKGRGQWGVQDMKTGDWLADGLDKDGALVEAENMNSEPLAA